MQKRRRGVHTSIAMAVGVRAHESSIPSLLAISAKNNTISTFAK